MESIRIDRIIEMVNRIGTLSQSQIGCTRFSYSKEDVEVRTLLVEFLEDLGLDVHIDPVGNIHARYAPDTVIYDGAVVMGSHIDTVPNGGKYDGTLGVVASLEVIQSIVEQQIPILRPLEIIVFAEEEGSNFGVTSLGCKLMTKQMQYEEIEKLHSFSGLQATDVMRQSGLRPEEITEYQLAPMSAFIELHIEQGPVLDREGYSVGIVDSIVGQRIYHVRILGESNHAGTTPMRYRRDALVCASSIACRLPELIMKNGGTNTVATVGKFDVTPNGANVIASEVNFWIDLRDTETTIMDQFVDVLNETIVTHAAKYRCSATFQLVSITHPTTFSEDIVACLKSSADEMSTPYLVLPSGAGHDSAVMNVVVPTAMIFVKSIDGISHSPLERIDENDVETGTRLLIKSVIKLANANTISAVYQREERRAGCRRINSAIEKETR